MSTPIVIMTAVLIPMPLALALAALMAPIHPAQTILFGAAGFVALAWIMIWCWYRPTRFELSTEGLRIVWPLRERLIPRQEITEAIALSGKQFRAQIGWGVRVGAGGLWGGFGYLLTPQGKMDMYISRTDPLVVVRLRGGRPLLITPERPSLFVEQVSALAR